jgi:hypothetical protein
MIDTEQTQASASIRKRPWCCINHDVGLGDAMMNDTVDFTRWIFVRLSASEACRCMQTRAELPAPVIPDQANEIERFNAALSTSEKPE